MQDQDLTLMGKAQEALEMMQLCTEGMKKVDSYEKQMMLLVHSMHLIASVRHIMSEALTDKELEIIKKAAGEEWDMWKKANTPEGAMALLELWNERNQS